ncbi:hypothetical protein [Salipaludibacillus neizhouensis]|uniref:hypothetical protein n=1 Tax=Salipaludibacillus neizhouensis TaxID=885475 RepID=UPI0015FF20AF|nr:hypothetical protein [Salipaludibacillus neizhouensis]
MIPEEVENRIAKYFFHNYLPDEVMMEIVDKLLPPCIYTEEEDLDIDELILWAIE